MKTLVFQLTYQDVGTPNQPQKSIDELNELLDLESQKNIDLHVQKARKRRHQVKIGYKEYKLSDFDTFKEEILEELKNVKYKDLGDMVYRLQLTYDEVINILDLKYIPTKKQVTP